MEEGVKVVASNLDVIKTVMAGATIAIGAFAPALAIGRIGAKAAESIARNPEAAAKIQMGMIIGCAFIEALTIYALLTVILLMGKIH